MVYPRMRRVPGTSAGRVHPTNKAERTMVDGCRAIIGVYGGG